jgi:hypothetical protein
MPDYPRLAAAIQARATALGWNKPQSELIRRATSSRGTVQRLWSGKSATYPGPGTKADIEDTLGWTRGSIDTILAGGEPTTRREASDESPSTDPHASAHASASAPEPLPLPVQLARENQRLLDYDVITFDVDGEPVTMAFLAYTGAYDDEGKRDVLRKQLEAFGKLRGHLRREVEAPPDTPSTSDE